MCVCVCVCIHYVVICLSVLAASTSALWREVGEGG